MAYNGSGSASAAVGGSYPASANTLIESGKFNVLIADILTMLSTAICKDGQTTTTARIPFASGIAVDDIDEKTSNNGVDVDGVLLKDGTVNPSTIRDSNGNEEVKFTATASAVNEITVANAATTTGPTISATGDDTNIDLNIAGKGTGQVKITKLASAIASGRNIAARTNSSTPNSKVDITADELIVKDTNSVAMLLSSVSLTLDITASGANGLDTAAEAGNTWYYGWVIAKPDGTTAGLISASATAPTMPSGYTYKGLATAVRNDGSSNFVKYRQRGNSVYYEAGVSVLSGGTASVETAITITSVVPPIAHAFSAYGNCTGAADVSGNWGGSPTLRVVSGSDFFASAYQNQGLVNTAAAGNSVPIPELPNISQTLLYLVTATAGSASLTVLITGFKLPMGGE